MMLGNSSVRGQSQGTNRTVILSVASKDVTQETRPNLNNGDVTRSRGSSLPCLEYVK